MPAAERTTTDALDVLRFQRLAEMADLGANLWDSLHLAAERGDNAIVEHNLRQIIVLTRSTAALVKRLGNAEADEAHG